MAEWLVVSKKWIAVEALSRQPSALSNGKNLSCHPERAKDLLSIHLTINPEKRKTWIAGNRTGCPIWSEARAHPRTS